VFTLLRNLVLSVMLTAGLSLPTAHAAEWLPAVFPGAEALGSVDTETRVTEVVKGGEVIGYVFETNDIAPIPAYSGKPVNMRVGLSVEGLITGVQVLDHSEPIMLVGIPVSVLDDFVFQYVGKSIHNRVRVGLSKGRARAGTH